MTRKPQVVFSGRSRHRRQQAVARVPHSISGCRGGVGEGGLLEGTKQGSLIVDVSTIPPVAMEEFAARAEDRGASMLDPPVSGGT